MDIEIVNIKDGIHNTENIKRVQNRKPYKYTNGWAEFYANNKIRKVYYDTHKDAISCELCKQQTDKYHLKQHQKTKKCIKLRCIDI